MVNKAFYINPNTFFDVGQDTIRQAEQTLVQATPVTQVNAPVARRVRTVSQPETAKAVTDTVFTTVQKGYDPEEPDFTKIISKKKEIWEYFKVAEKVTTKKVYHHQPIFSPDSLAATDSSSYAYQHFISQPPSKFMIENVAYQGIKADWMFGIIIFSLLLLTWIKLFFNKYFVQIIGSLLNYQLSYKLLRDRNVLYARISVLLNVVFILNLGLFLQITLQHFHLQLFHFSGFVNYLLYCGVIAVISFVQVLILKIIGGIFLRTNEFNEYIHNIFISNKGTGIFLLPIILCLPYISDVFIKPLIIIGLVVVGALYFWRFIRGFKIIISKDILKFYLILYFCTLEILPVLLLYKFLQSTVNSGGF